MSDETTPDLTEVIHYALVERTSDHIWADQTAAHLAEQITAAGFGPVRAAEAALAGLREGIEAACGKSLALTQDAMGQRSQHWRGPDYADGLDQGIEIAVALVRDAIASTPNCEEGQ